MGGGDFLVEPGVEFCGEVGAVAFDVELEVEAQAAGVPVAGADVGPGVVHDEEFGVVEGGWGEPDAAAADEDLPELCAGGPADGAEVAFLGDDDVHFDAAQGAGVEGADEAGVGKEVGGGDSDAVLGAGECGVEGGAEFVVVFVGAVCDAAGEDIAAGFEWDEPGFAGELFAGGEGPVFDECLLELAHDGAFDAEVEVLDGIARVGGQDVVVADIHAAGEGGLTVHDEDFSVVAQVDVGHAPVEEGGHEDGVVDVAPVEGAVDGGEGVARADVVNEDAHFDAARDGVAEGVGEAEAGGVVVEDVGAEGDAAGRLCDGVEHGGIGLVAILEGCDAVAIEERGPADAVDGEGEGCEVLVFGGEGGGGEGVFFVARFEGGWSAAAEMRGAALNAVDAEENVEHGAHDGEEKDQADPGGRGAGVALVENGVACRPDINDQQDRGCDVWPNGIQQVWHGKRIVKSLRKASAWSSFNSIDCKELWRAGERRSGKRAGLGYSGTKHLPA